MGLLLLGYLLIVGVIFYIGNMWDINKQLDSYSSALRNLNSRLEILESKFKHSENQEP